MVDCRSAAKHNTLQWSLNDTAHTHAFALFTSVVHIAHCVVGRGGMQKNLILYETLPLARPCPGVSGAIAISPMLTTHLPLLLSLVLDIVVASC